MYRLEINFSSYLRMKIISISVYRREEGRFIGRKEVEEEDARLYTHVLLIARQ